MKNGTKKRRAESELMPEKKRTMESVRDENPPVYANNVTLEMTPWDFKLRFGEVVEITEEKLRVLERVTVVMSPQHAVALAEVLARNILAYEKNVGPIPRPKGSVQAEGKFA